MDNEDNNFIDDQDAASARFAALEAVLYKGRFSAFDTVKAASKLTSIAEAASRLAAGLPRFDAALAASGHAASVIESARVFAAGLPQLGAALTASDQFKSISASASRLAAGLPRFDAALAASSHAASIVQNSKVFAAGLPQLGATLAASDQFTSIAEAASRLTAGLPRFDAALAASGHAASVIESARVFAAGLSRVEIPDLSSAQYSAMQSALVRFGEIGSEIYSNYESRSALFRAVEEFTFSSIDCDHIEEELIESIEQYEQANGQASYFSVFKGFPQAVKLLILFFFFDVFISQLNSISANFITDLIKPYVFNEDLSQREKIREIKSTPLKLEDFNTDGFRFIKGNNVRLRAEPSIKSEVLGELILGQVVTVVSKNKNWIEVMYECEDGTVLTGWVFTRYTSRFVK